MHLARATWIVVLVAFAQGGGQAIDVPEPRPLTPRGSILIDGDADLDAAHGVRRGSGTAADPFVISGWIVAQDRLPAIALRNVTKHVVVERVLIPVQPPHTAAASCLPSVALSCYPYLGIEVRGSSNVTLRDSHVMYGEAGIAVVDSRDVLVERVTLGYAAPSGFRMPTAVAVIGSDGVTIRQLDLRGVQSGFLVRGSRGITIADNHLDAGNVTARVATLVGPVDSLVIAGNTFEGVRLYVDGHASNLTLAGNTFRNGSAGFGGGAPTTLRDSQLCGNSFERGGAAVHVGGSTNVTVVGNRLHHNTFGIRLGPSTGARVEHNDVTDHTAEAVVVAGEDTLLRHNRLEGNTRGVELTMGGDARWNWWGDPSGPSGMGPGAGDPLVGGPGTVVRYDPWLAAPPAGPISC